MKKLKIKRIVKNEIMNQLDYLIKQDDQLSQSMPECENINRDGENDEN
ncbi:hypothetical protein OAJ02_05090 [Nitrosopumilus sp.]|nr:hypothetical protein [Nitrosopumilus sp.]